ncbi:MAG: hypothetical protein IJO61_05120 [Oscillospiraceae bacterium]|nr:hypothetical protein [Oscillospiraceae bacterium]
MDETTTTTTTTISAEETSEEITTSTAMPEFQQEVLGHMRFQTSCFQFFLVGIVAWFIWKFLKQFF